MSSTVKSFQSFKNQENLSSTMSEALKRIAENKAKHARGEDARVLDLGNCGLTEVPEEVGELVWLEELILSNEWTEFSFVKMEQVINRSANRGSGNNITSGFSRIEGLKELRKLVLEGTWVKDISPILNLFELEELNCNRTLISSISLLTDIPNLKMLYCAKSRLKDLSFVSRCKNLKLLDCSGWPIANLGPLAVLERLEYLRISDTTERPPLSEINFSDFNNIHFEVWKKNFFEPLSRLANIIFLDISESKFENLLILKQLKRIKYLNISKTAIRDLSEISELDSLEYFDCSFTQITDLSALQNWHRLKTLICNNTLIKDASIILKLKNLTDIQFRNNRITEINKFILDLLMKKERFRYKNLLFIDKFLQMPRVDGTNYFYLYTYKIALTTGESIDIKDDLLDSTWIKYIFQGNPLVIPPVEIFNRGIVATQLYFLERSKQQFKNHELKLILLGNSTAGKSSLSYYLRERHFELKRKTTEGIDPREKWSPEGRDMQVNVWDFGGQEYYHATHRLFLSRNAVYILVWDGKTNKGGIEPTEIYFEKDPKAYTVALEHFSSAWWLKNLHFNLNKYTRHEREGNAPIPVLLVQNKCAAGDGYEIQDVPVEFGAEPFFLPAKWRNHHIDILAAASEQARGEQGDWTLRFKLFESELLKTLESQMATYEFAIYHREIRDQVRALASAKNPVNQMSWQDFEAMCQDIEPEAKMDLVRIYLRDITGDILYFEQNERLKHRVFLRPDWVCNCIYAILSRQVLEREGLFDLDWVRRVLKCDEQEALDFVELMRMFELIFPDKDENGELNGQYIAPQYLPEHCRRAEYLQGLKEDKILTHAFTLWFPEFLPKSHFARFISNWGAKAEGRVFWKNGLLFRVEQLKVLVECSEDFKIRIDIQTGERQNRIKAMRRVLKAFLELEDGQGYWETPEGLPWQNGDGTFWKMGDGAKFAVSLDANDYVLWNDIYEAAHMKASHVKTYPEKLSRLIDLHPFKIFLKPTTMPKKIFISYAHRDEEAMRELDKYLGPLERKGEIEIWTDREILPGQNWNEAIMQALESADLTLLLVSANFLDSNFINDEEIPIAFKRREEAGKHVVPIILNHCLWDLTDLGSLQAIPQDGRPIADFPNPALAWSEVTRSILALLK